MSISGKHSCSFKDYIHYRILVMTRVLYGRTLSVIKANTIAVMIPLTKCIFLPTTIRRQPDRDVDTIALMLSMLSVVVNDIKSAIYLIYYTVFSGKAIHSHIRRQTRIRSKEFT